MARASLRGDGAETPGEVEDCKIGDGMAENRVTIKRKRQRSDGGRMEKTQLTQHPPVRTPCAKECRPKFRAAYSGEG